MVNKLAIYILLIGFPLVTLAQNKKWKVTVKDTIHCVRGSYSLVFQDHFEGDTLDTSKWYTYYPYGPQSQKDSCSFCRTHVSANIYRDQNVIVEHGTLLLKSDRESGTWFDRNMDYTSGMVHSKQNFTTYGKYEIRCKLPSGKQLWPAFWIFGWSTEIDIFEFICKGTRKLEFSIHKWINEECPNKNPSKNSPCYSSASGMVDFGIDFSKEFHTFSVEYEPHMIKYYIDDIMVRYVPKYYTLRGQPINSCRLLPGEYLEEPSFPIFGQPVQVIANQSVCWKHKEKNPIFPNYMEIDHISVYQKEIQGDLYKIDSYSLKN